MGNNILILTNSIGGLHSFRKEVVKAIVDAGYEVYISEPDDDERVRYFEEIGCHIVKTDFNRRGMVIKFKTMTDERDAEGKLLPDAQRLTKVGKFVRSTLFDELSQLINVSKGDMALVGPSLLLPLPLYSPVRSRKLKERNLQTRPAR